METLQIMTKLVTDYPDYTPEAQITWLRKKGFSPQVIDFAMTDVYFGLSKGKKYPSGYEMDQELLRIAQAYETQEARVVISSANTLKKQMEGGRWKKLWWVLTGEL